MAYVLLNFFKAPLDQYLDLYKANCLICCVKSRFWDAVQPYKSKKLAYYAMFRVNCKACIV